MFGHPQAHYGFVYKTVLLVPVALIGYSLFYFRGNKWAHTLQAVNLVWLFCALIFGQMAVTGIWP